MSKKNGEKWIKTHLSILHTSKNLFEKNGILNTTIENISKSSNIARSTFFSHFSSLEDLYIELTNKEFNDLIQFVNGQINDKVFRDIILKNLFSKLVDDTLKYPKTFLGLLVRGLISGKDIGSQFLELERLVLSMYNDTLSLTIDATPVNSFLNNTSFFVMLFGQYFGLIFKELANTHNPSLIDERNIKRQLFEIIDFLKN